MADRPTTKPLTAAEILALPEGTRVVWCKEDDDYMRPADYIRSYARGKPGLRTRAGSIELRAGVCVWLAED